MTNENPFAKAAETAKDTTPVVEVPTQAAKPEPTQTGRRVISEETVQESNYTNLPNKDGIGEQTPDLKIAINGYYNQDGQDLINKKTMKPFYTGLEKSNGDKAGEFIVEGTIDGTSTQIRLSNWELVYKMGALVKYCRTNNFTLANQIISFKRVDEGMTSAGENWELHCSTLKLTITGRESDINLF